MKVLPASIASVVAGLLVGIPLGRVILPFTGDSSGRAAETAALRAGVQGGVGTVEGAGVLRQPGGPSLASTGAASAGNDGAAA